MVTAGCHHAINQMVAHSSTKIGHASYDPVSILIYLPQLDCLRRKAHYSSRHVIVHRSIIVHSSIHTVTYRTDTVAEMIVIVHVMVGWHVSKVYFIAPYCE